MIGKYIKAVTAANSALTAIIGSRIYPTFAPQAATQSGQVFPYAVWTQGIEVADRNKTQRPTQYNCTVTFTIWSNRYDDLDAVDTAMQNALDWSEQTAGGITCVNAEYLNGADIMDEQMEFYGRTAIYTFKIKRNG